jgi:glycosyltransferase involved in cell wall biosynthesis
MSRLSRHNKILWINSIGLRTPTFSSADASRILSKVKSFFNGIERVNQNLWVISPVVIPFHKWRAVKSINTLILRIQLGYYIRKLGMKNIVFWTFLPNTANLLGVFKPFFSVYYITDDFTKFEGYPAEAIRKMERDLIEKSDCIIASAKELSRKKQHGGKIIHTVNHGVNHAHFARALTVSGDEIPEDIRNINHPLLGFYGEINSWIDLPLIAEAARKRPQWSFVLIGRVGVEAGNIDYLKRIPNVYFLGQKNYRELPFYCAAFDAALIPMKVNDLTVCVNPLKLREYLAAGVPVISAPLPEVQPYADAVSFAGTADELVAAFEEMNKKGKKEHSRRLSKRVEAEGWDGKVEEISGIIQEALNRQEETPAAKPQPAGK